MSFGCFEILPGVSNPCSNLTKYCMRLWSPPMHSTFHIRRTYSLVCTIDATSRGVSSAGYSSSLGPPTTLSINYLHIRRCGDPGSRSVSQRECLEISFYLLASNFVNSLVFPRCASTKFAKQKFSAPFCRRHCKFHG